MKDKNFVTKQSLIDKVKGEGRTALTEVESKELLKQARINVVDARLATSREEAISISRKLGFPVALKIASPDIVHKSDVSGVKLGLRTANQVGKAYDDVIQTISQKYPRARLHGVAVQKMARPGVEVIIGMYKDAQFGPVLMFGLGGVMVEVLKDVSFRIAPLAKRDAAEMLREIKGYPLLEGFRGQEAVDASYLEDMLLKVSDFVRQNPEVKELDLNPVFAYSDGALVVDARVILDEVSEPEDWRKQGEQLRRSEVSTWDHFNSIFYPRSVAVIGASPDFNRLGYHCMSSLVMGRFPGKIYPVHPSLSEIMGFKAYPSIEVAPGEIDLAIIAVRSSLVPALLIECAEKGVKGVVLITAGFKESEDKAGAELQHEVASIANQANIKIIGPNTFGFVNLHANLNASFTPEFSLTPKGGISLVSQSGGFCHLMAPLAMEQHVGMSKIIGIGNRCNVDFADILEYLADDPDTKVIMLYVEGTDDARPLFEVGSSVTKRKPIVAFKAGRFSLSDKAAYSHTGSMAGKYEVYTAAFKQAGILIAEGSTELMDIAKALALCPLPKGNRVAVLSGQAGPGMIMSDICEENSLVLADFSPQTTKRLDQLLAPLAMRANPVDMGPAWYNSQTIREVIELVLTDENIDGVLLYAAYASANRPLLKEITSLLKSPAYGKPIISCFPSPTGVWVEEKQELVQNGVVIYPTPERAAKAMVGLAKQAYRQAKEYPD